MRHFKVSLLLTIIIVAYLSIAGVHGNLLAQESKKARGEADKPVEFTLEQEVGMNMVPTKLIIRREGFSYKNRDMKKWRKLPWSAITQWKGVNLSRESVTGRVTKVTYKLDIDVDNYRIPNEMKSLTISKVSQLYFITCCDESIGEHLVEAMRKYHGRAEH